MTSVLYLTIPLILVLLVSNIYSVRVFDDKIADSNTRSMNYRAARIEEELNAVDDFLTNLMAVSDDFRVLQGGAGQLNAHLASHSLYTQMKTAMPSTGIKMAIAVVGVLPVLVVYPFFQKYFVKGMTIGSVKG